MAEARQFDLWNYASSVMALLANLQRDPKKGRALRPQDFHPLSHLRAAPREPTPIKADLSILKTVFVDQRPVE
jgi:hypothetical protein